LVTSLLSPPFIGWKDVRALDVETKRDVLLGGQIVAILKTTRPYHMSAVASNRFATQKPLIVAKNTNPKRTKHGESDNTCNPRVHCDLANFAT